jgi:hypothetical protein
MRSFVSRPVFLLVVAAFAAIAGPVGAEPVAAEGSDTAPLDDDPPRSDEGAVDAADDDVDDDAAPRSSPVLDALGSVLGLSDLRQVDAWLAAQEGYRVRAMIHPRQRGIDHDLRFLLDGGFSAAEGRLEGSGSMALFVDLDGTDNEPGLRSVHDPRGRFDLLVQDLALTYRGAPWLKRLSVGRLTVLEGWPLIIDGVAATFTPLQAIGGLSLLGLQRSELFFNAGRTVHFYDLDTGLFEDWSAQAGGALTLGRWARAEVDYRALVEDSTAFGIDHDYGTSVTLTGGPYVRARAYARGLNLALSRLGASALWTVPQIGLDGALRVDAQTIPLGTVHERLDPFYAMLGTSEPFVRWHLELGESFVAPWLSAGVRVGSSGRWRLQGADTAFNRSYGRGFVLAQLADPVIKGPFVTASLEYLWAETFTEDSAFAVGGALGYRHRRWVAELGSDYQRYKYTYFKAANELADVRTLYTRVRLPLVGPIGLAFDYRVEIFDRVIHTASLNLVQNVDAHSRWTGELP